MMLLDQTVEHRLPIRPSDLPELEGNNIRQLPFHGRLVYLYPGRLLAMNQRIYDPDPDGRQFDLPRPGKMKHQPPTHHVPKRPVGLPPIPGLTKLPGKHPTTVATVLRNELPDKDDFFVRDRSASVSHHRLHAQDITESLTERKGKFSNHAYFFQAFLSRRHRSSSRGALREHDWDRRSTAEVATHGQPKR